jgi:hypothetical protein
VTGLGLAQRPNIELNLIVDSDRDRHDLLAWFDEIWSDDTLTTQLGYASPKTLDTGDDPQALLKAVGLDHSKFDGPRTPASRASGDPRRPRPVRAAPRPDRLPRALRTLARRAVGGGAEQALLP